MKRVFLAISFVLAAVVITFGVVASLRQRGDLQQKNIELTSEVKGLKQTLSNVDPQASWYLYQSKKYGFEFRYPREVFSGERAKVADAVARNGMKGLEFYRSTSGCVIEVYISPASATSNPFDETGAPPKETRYAESVRLEFGSYAYHVGMGVVSHAVDPQGCNRILKQILPTFRLIPGWAPDLGDLGVGGSQAKLSPSAAGRLRELGVADPEQALRSDLMKHPELIPFRGVLGGTPGFHDRGSIVLLPNRWVYAGFDDGHVEGSLVAAWDISPDGTISWKVVDAECPSC